jgi:hypothetical protein
MIAATVAAPRIPDATPHASWPISPDPESALAAAHEVIVARDPIAPAPQNARTRSMTAGSIGGPAPYRLRDNAVKAAESSINHEPAGISRFE